MIIPLPGDGFKRSSELLENRSVLYPGKYLSVTDIEDHGLARYGTSPVVDRAIDEIVAAGPRLDGASGVRSDLGALLLRALIATNRAAPMPFREGRDTSALREPKSGLLSTTLLEIAGAAAIDGDFSGTSMAEKHGEAGRELFTAWRAHVPEERDLDWVLARCKLPITSLDNFIPPTRAEVEAMSAESLARAVALSSIYLSMPAIDIAASLVPDGIFAGASAVCVQHVLGTQVALFAALENKGLEARRTQIIGAPYSTSFITQEALRARGYRVDTPRLTEGRELEDLAEELVTAALRVALKESAREKILILDDGGLVVRTIHRHFARDAQRFFAVEQTARGVTEIAALEPCLVPVVDVARSKLKRHESRKIGHEIASGIDRKLRRIGMKGVVDRKIFVIGYGMIGSGVALKLAEQGAVVSAFDTQPRRMDQAVRDGFRVESGVAVEDKDVIIGCTGHRTMGRAEMARMKSRTVMASGSSRDIEIDMRLGASRAVRTMILAHEGPGDDRFLTRLWRFKDKDLIVLHNGFPINFSGGPNPTPPKSIQLTRAIMLLGAAQAIQTDAPGIHGLDLAQQDALAAAIDAANVDLG